MVCCTRSSTLSIGGIDRQEWNQVVVNVSVSPSLTSNSSACRPSAAFGSRGPAQHHHVGPRDRGDHVVAVLVAPPGHPRLDLAVVESDDPLVPHPQSPGEPLDPPDDVGSPVGDRHEVGDLHRPVRAAVDRLEDERVGHVRPGRSAAILRRPDQPAPVLGLAEQGRETRRRVEPREAQPVDRPVEPTSAAVSVSPRRAYRSMGSAMAPRLCGFAADVPSTR